MKYKFYEPVMATDIVLVVGREESAYQDKEYLDTHTGSVFQIKKQRGEKFWFEYQVYIEDPKDFYTLSHECIHLVKHLFRDRGIPFSDLNDEMVAYYHTFLLKKFWRRIAYTKKRKK